MTAFDAHLRPQGDDSAWRHAATMMRARPGVVVASIAAAATIVAVAFCALIAFQELRFRATQAVDDVRASIFLRPQTSRAAAEALKGQLDALPFVRDASLHTKETALAALETGGLPALNRVNPLPDVWIVTLGLGVPGDAATSLSERVAQARQSLARLPEVESVDVDDAWFATLDRWQALAVTGIRGAFTLLIPLVLLLLGCVFFLTGRGLAGTPPSGHRDGVGPSPPAVVGVIVGVATLLASAALLGAAIFGAQSVGLDWKPIVGRIGQMSGTSVAALGSSVLILAVVAIGSAGRSR